MLAGGLTKRLGWHGRGTLGDIQPKGRSFSFGWLEPILPGRRTASMGAGMFRREYWSRGFVWREMGQLYGRRKSRAESRSREGKKEEEEEREEEEKRVFVMAAAEDCSTTTTNMCTPLAGR
jgi:hypothetical protein